MAHKKNKYRAMPQQQLQPVAAPKESLDFAAMRVGKRKITDDVVADFGNCVVKRRNRRLYKQEDVERMIRDCCVDELREVSNYFFRKSGIYQRLCRYLAYLYRFDWIITPVETSDVKPDKVIEGWYKASTLLENSNIKQSLGNITLDVLRNGCYYGIIIRGCGYNNTLPILVYCNCFYVTIPACRIKV